LILSVEIVVGEDEVFEDIEELLDVMEYEVDVKDEEIFVELAVDDSCDDAEEDGESVELVETLLDDEADVVVVVVQEGRLTA